MTYSTITFHSISLITFTANSLSFFIFLYTCVRVLIMYLVKKRTTFIQVLTFHDNPRFCDDSTLRETRRLFISNCQYFTISFTSFTWKENGYGETQQMHKCITVNNIRCHHRYGTSYDSFLWLYRMLPQVHYMTVSGGYIWCLRRYIVWQLTAVIFTFLFVLYRSHHLKTTTVPFMNQFDVPFYIFLYPSYQF